MDMKEGPGDLLWDRTDEPRYRIEDKEIVSTVTAAYLAEPDSDDGLPVRVEREWGDDTLGVYRLWWEDDEYEWDLWAVGGNLPWTFLNTDLCRTPGECLAITTYFLRYWGLRTGAGRSFTPDEIPHYRDPVTRRPFDDRNEDLSWVGSRETILLYDILPTIWPEVSHPELLDRMRTIGVPGEPGGHGAIVGDPSRLDDVSDEEEE